MLTIHLPDDLEKPLRSEVESGHFASIDAAVVQAVRVFLDQRPRTPEAPPTADENGKTAHKPIWEKILELTADIPDEVWEKIPTDSAEQHDHYIYGTPKRPTKP